MALLVPRADDGVIVIPRHDPALSLPALEEDPSRVTAIEVRTDEYGRSTVSEILQRHDVRSLVVVHRGHLVLDWYLPGRDAARRNPCFSVTKSFTGTLAATACRDGALDRDATIGSLLPELATSGFADATVGQIADMTASVGYHEDYDEAADPTGDPSALSFGDYLIALGLEPPGTVVPEEAPRTLRNLLGRIERGPRAHGEAFDYITPASDLLGWILERATARPYPELFSERIWSRLGAEHDAWLSTDPAGIPVMGAGLAMTTRDLARFGLLLADESVFPRTVIETIRDGGSEAAFRRNTHYSYLRGYTYRDQWWMPGGPTRPMSAWGIYGQLLWVDPDADIVIACHAGGDKPSDARRDAEQDAMCRALTAAATNGTVAPWHRH